VVECDTGFGVLFTVELFAANTPTAVKQTPDSRTSIRLLVL
jgi:hypothetical protein